MLNMNQTDEELYLLLKEDNVAAFDMLFNRYWDKMLYKALVKLRSEDDAKEIVQDSLMDIWKGRKRNSLTHKFCTYLGAIVAYKIMRKLAMNKRRIDQSVEDLNFLNEVDNSTQEKISYLDLLAEVEAIVTTLPERCRLVFRMSRFDGKSNTEIADELGISSNVVKKQVNKAIKVIRKNINNFYLCVFSCFSNPSAALMIAISI